METLQENSIANKLPKLPKLVTKANWPKFWLIMEHWLTKPKYSVGKGGKLTHVDSNDEFNNVKASGYVDDALVGVLDGNVLRKFLHRKDLYTKKGFKKIDVLKANFTGASGLQIPKEMFAFLQEFSQGDSSPDS